MTPDHEQRQARDDAQWLSGQRGERIVFIVLAIVIWPVIAIGVVGGYGFIVWMFQLLTGPPSPPGA